MGGINEKALLFRLSHPCSFLAFHLAGRNTKHGIERTKTHNTCECKNRRQDKQHDTESSGNNISKVQDYK